MRETAILGSILLLSISWALPQNPAATETTVKARSTKVLVDATVFDRQGNPVRGLEAQDFEIYEDGSQQSLTSVEELTGDHSRAETNRRSDAPEATQAPPDSSAVPIASPLDRSLRNSFVAIVTNSQPSGDRDGPHGSWVTTWNTARDYVSDFKGDHTHVGIFLIDLDLNRLKTVEFFTADKDRLLGAIRRARVDPAAVQETPSPFPIASLAEAFRDLSREFEGRTMTDAFLTLLHSMQILPGRKSILFLSREGVRLPPSLISRFWDVVHLADRLETAIYTVDAAGLRVRSTAPQVVRGSSSATLDSDPDQPQNRSLLKSVSEGSEDALRADPHYSMNVLARETGGLFIRDTNDLRTGLKRIQEHLGSYYLLAYTPENLEFDGRFRTIEVRVKEPNVQVRHRGGYYAVDAAFDQPLLEYEKPAVAALESGQDVHTLPIQASVLTFPRKDEGHLATILAALGPGQITYRPGEKDGEVSNITIVALVKGESGDLVAKVSQQYLLSRAAGSSGSDSIFFYRELVLDPGKYTLEVAGFDALSGCAGTYRNQLEVPAPRPELPGLSSVVIVDFAERAGSQTRKTPFRYGELLLYPSLDNQVRKAQRNELTFYFAVFPRQDPVQAAIVDLMQGGTVVHRTRIDLPEPDAERRIQYAGSLPIGAYTNGVYMLRVTVLAGEKAVSRTRPVLLVP